MSSDTSLIHDAQVSMALDIKAVETNVRRSENKYSDLSLFADWKEDKHIAIVGGGPSLAETVDLLRTNKYHKILVCGSAHDYLYGAGVVPDYCLVTDPDPIMANYLRKGNKFFTTYFIATQCDKAVFDLFNPLSKVYTYNAGGDDEFNKIFDSGTFLKGGCTVGTRAIMLALGMGYSKIDLFGFDTCITETEHHAYKFNNPEVEKIGEITEISLVPDGRKFKMADYMIGQFFDIKKILIANYGRMHLTVHGDGIIAEFIKLVSEKVTELQITPNKV